MKRDRTYRLPCGCFVTHSRIVKPCEECDGIDRDIRARWAADHKAKVAAAEEADQRDLNPQAFA